MNKVIVITGPTAVGKTKLSIAIAKKLKTELINGDAYQIYKKMNIGTAKPSESERDGIIHHLMDFIDPSENYSVAQYQKDVRNCIKEFNDKNLIPIIVGGSGFYIDSVIKDYRFEEEKHSFQETDFKYANLSNVELYEILKKLDCDVANKIHQNNRKRVLRAIELINSPVNKNSRSHRDDYCFDSLIVFLNDDRNELYNRINNRVLKMVDSGLVEEVSSIGEKNFSDTSKVAIGYKECLSYLNNEITKEQMIELIQKNSRHYAKRQFTWFKNKMNSTIVNININDFNQTINNVYNIIIEFLNKR